MRISIIELLVIGLFITVAVCCFVECQTAIMTRNNEIQPVDGAGGDIDKINYVSTDIECSASETSECSISRIEETGV
jgi:hypothetical protein